MISEIAAWYTPAILCLILLEFIQFSIVHFAKERLKEKKYLTTSVSDGQLSFKERLQRVSKSADFLLDKQLLTKLDDQPLFVYAKLFRILGSTIKIVGFSFLFAFLLDIYINVTSH